MFSTKITALPYLMAQVLEFKAASNGRLDEVIQLRVYWAESDNLKVNEFSGHNRKK
jgi:hypothetical protein